MKKKNTMVRFLLIIILSFIFISMIIFTTRYINQSTELEVEDESNIVSQFPNSNVLEDESKEETMETFKSVSISDDIFQRINGKSWKENTKIQLDDLRYVTVTYWGFDDKTHIGELIVHKSVEEEIIDIFKELYEVKFPIEKIKLIDDYDGDDNLSMEDNNTSAFNFRVVEGTDKISKHSYGIAIDINPVQNPYIRKDTVSPEQGTEYVDRSNVRKGMIVKDDLTYKAFVSRGWTWGGEWNSVKDYQHFEKNIQTN